MNWSAVWASIRAATGERFEQVRVESVGGGCINRCFRLLAFRLD